MDTRFTTLEFKLFRWLCKLQFDFKIEANGIILLNLLVSGGKDSLCLLYAMHTILNSHKLSLNYSIVPIVTHINHKKRGSESDDDAMFVLNTCLKLGIECFVENISSQKKIENFQNFARKERQKIALQVSRQYATHIKSKQFFILTAHHAQDHVESVLMHLIRGSGIHGLQGFYGKQSSQFLKPFSEISLAEIQTYRDKKLITFQEDSSNSTNKYSRNFLRHEILPKFLKLNPQYEKHILNFSKQLKQAADMLENRMEKEPQNKTLLICPDTTATEIYSFLTSYFDLKNISISQNLIHNILHEAEILRKDPTKKLKNICLPKFKKMTLRKNYNNYISCNIC